MILTGRVTVEMLSLDETRG